LQGKAAKDFLDPKNRPFVLDLYKTPENDNGRERKALNTILEQLYVILRVTESDSKVKTDTFHLFNIDTYLKVA
jgi:hypothetical protein